MARLERVPVRSTNLAWVGYDERTKLLVIGFLNGAVYVYPGVPDWEHEQLLAPPNLMTTGEYFGRYVKPHYKGVQII